MKLDCTVCTHLIPRRSPCGERGLKWAADVKANVKPLRRSPCGERGLKLHAGTQQRTHTLSLPVRGAWIEIQKTESA